MPNANSCPRCGLVLPKAEQPPSQEQSSLPVVTIKTDPDDRSYVTANEQRQATVSNYFPTPPTLSIETPHETGPSAVAASGAVADAGGQTGPLQSRGQTGPLPRHNTGPLTPRGALELLPGESISYQIGALYLTTKRVILLAPSVVRSAFIRDIDAVGTFTEKSSAVLLALACLLFAVVGGGVYLSFNSDAAASLPVVDALPPWIISLALLFPALFLLLRYLVWSKRTLFVSVKGRPLITVSIADWDKKKLDSMDEFVNSFFQIKDLMTGELDDQRIRQF